MSIVIKAPSGGGSISLDTQQSVTGDHTLLLPTGVGSANQVLKNSGTAGTLEFGDVGKILNVESVTNTTGVKSTQTTYQDLFTAAITPSAATSKILILASLAIGHDNSQTALMRIVKKVGTGSYAAFAGGVGSLSNHDDNTWWNIRNSTYNVAPHTVVYLDTPNTTDQVTYKAQGKTSSSTRAFTLNQSVQELNYQYESPCMSTITLLEVGA